MDMSRHTAVRENIHRNCLISDARYGRNDTLCVYLLKMREFFRWEQGLDFDDPIDSEALGEWVQAREALWDEVEEQHFEPVCTDDCHPPLEAQAISAPLEAHGLLYGAGVGRQGQPHFFLAELEAHFEDEGLHYYITGRELERGLTVLPAMLQENRVYIRRAALRQMLFERLDEWRFNGSRPDQPMGRLVASVGEQDTHALLEAMTEREARLLMWHEQGEARMDRRLAGWPERVNDCLGRPLERWLRALKDLLADLEYYWPQALAADDDYAIHAWFANFKGVRLALAGDLKAAYARWLSDGDRAALRQTLQAQRDEWLQLAEAVLPLAEAEALEKIQAACRRPG